MRGRFVVAAALAHAAAFVLLPSRSATDAEPPAATSAAEQEIALDEGVGGAVVPATAAPSAGASEPAESAIATAERAPAHAGPRAAEVDARPPPAGPVASSAPQTPAPPSPPSRPYSLAELGLAGSSGLVGTSRFLGGGAPPEAAPRAPDVKDDASRRAERAITDPLARRDQELGLGPDGPVLVALRDAAYAGTTSINGRAVLRATADSDGVVTSVEVLDVSADRAAWEAIAAEVRRALQKKPLRVSRRSRGVSMRIEVISRWQLPSGHDPGGELSVLGIPLIKGAGPNSTKLQILNPKTGAILGVVGDPADIGAHARRLVTAHVVDEAAL